jgi:hypothetical protein
MSKNIILVLMHHRHKLLDLINVTLSNLCSCKGVVTQKNYLYKVLSYINAHYCDNYRQYLLYRIVLSPITN